MSLALIVTIFGLVNTLLTIVKDAPGAADAIKTLLAEVEPFIDQGHPLAPMFADLKAKAAAL